MHWHSKYRNVFLDPEKILASQHESNDDLNNLIGDLTELQCQNAIAEVTDIQALFNKACSQAGLLTAMKSYIDTYNMILTKDDQQQKEFEGYIQTYEKAWEVFSKLAIQVSKTDKSLW